MIRIEVDLISAIDPSRNKHLGTILICNDGSGVDPIGHYTVDLKKTINEYSRRTARVENFNRKRNSWIKLLREAILALTGGQSA